MSEAKYLDVEQHLYYHTQGAITASMLAESLMGLDGMAKCAAEFISGYLGVEIRGAEVLISSVKFGSLEEEWYYRLIFGKGKAAEKRFEDFRQALGFKDMDAKKLIGAALTLCVAYGIYQYASTKGNQVATTHIEHSFNQTSVTLNLPKEELMTLLDERIKNKEGLKKSLVSMAYPDGHDASGKLVLNGDAATTIPQEAMDALPRGYEKEEAEEPFKDFPNTQVAVRAMDLDKPASGWWAMAPDISEKRIQLSLADGIDPMTLPYGKYMQADLTVTYKVDARGNRSPHKILLRKILSR